MPSYATHAIFAEDSYERAFGQTAPAPVLPWLVAGAQGPDPFFSGVRRMPSGEAWAARMHREGFGRATALMAEAAARAREEDSGDAEALTAFAAGFASHAVLDRAVHPFVHYFSGWTDTADPDTEAYRFCHPYMERCIDLIMLRRRRGTSLAEYGFPPTEPLLEDRTRLLGPLFAACIVGAYPDAPDSAKVEAMARNALLDDADFMELMDPRKDAAAAAVEMEQRGELPPRILALFFPRENEIPSMDFMNDSGRPWRDPRTGEDRGSSSFEELFDTALDDAAEAMIRVAAAEGVGEFLGDGNLDDGRTDGAEFPMVHSDPLPFASVIDGLYEALAARA